MKTPEFFTEDQVRRDLEAAITKAGGIRAFAQASGVSESMIYESRNVTRPIFPKLCAVLGYRRADRMYIKEGASKQ